MCVTEYESSEIMIKHTAEIMTKKEDLFIFTLPAVHSWIVRGGRDPSWHNFSNLSVKGLSSSKRPTDLVNAMITSNSGCDLRPPVDTYAFKSEARQCSLELVLTASCCAACAFIQRGQGFAFEGFSFIILHIYTQ